MRHLTYVAVLAGCLLGTLPLEVVLGVRVWRRRRRLALTLLPVLVVFVTWDVYAISRGEWGYDLGQMLGIVLPGSLPLEELLFFLVIPVCAVLTLEAVAAVRRWPTDDPRRLHRPTRGRTGPAAEDPSPPRNR